MAIVRVPGPPPEAFRKNRLISDLIKSQIAHFQHLEHKLQLTLPTKFRPHDLTTEGVASQYIAEITAALCSRAAAEQQIPTPMRIVPPHKPDTTPAARSVPQSVRPSSRVDIAASSAPLTSRTKKSTAMKTPKKKRS